MLALKATPRGVWSTRQYQDSNPGLSPQPLNSLGALFLFPISSLPMYDLSPEVLI